MLAHIVSSFVAVYSAVAAQAIDRYSETMFCQEHLREKDWRRLIVATLEVDNADRPLEHSISLSGQDYRVNWRYPDGRFLRDVPSDGLEIPSIALKPEVSFPVTATIRFDGRVVWTEKVARASHIVVGLRGPGSPRTFRPGIAIRIGPAGVPTPFGVDNAEIVVTGADGAEAARQRFAVPDWANLERRLAGVFTRLEAERLAGRCRRIVTRTIVD